MQGKAGDTWGEFLITCNNDKLAGGVMLHHIGCWHGVMQAFGIRRRSVNILCT